MSCRRVVGKARRTKALIFAHADSIVTGRLDLVADSIFDIVGSQADGRAAVVDRDRCGRTFAGRGSGSSVSPFASKPEGVVGDGLGPS